MAEGDPRKIAEDYLENPGVMRHEDVARNATLLACADTIAAALLKAADKIAEGMRLYIH